MEMATAFGIAGLTGAGALVYGWCLLSSGGKETPQPEEPTFIAGEPMPAGLKKDEQEITLQMLSSLWLKDKVQQLRFDELAHIWRKVEVKVEDKVRDPEFLHDEISQFYQDRVRGRPFFVGDALNATIDLLILLDKEGSCSSVVRQNDKEPEKNYDADTYNLLAQVPLYRHSLNVARAAMDKVGKGAIVPKAALAALAHDLGKMPFYYNKYYKNSAHPIVGLSVAETIPSVKGIKWFDEIGAAIKNHHGQSMEYLDSLIREADQTARRFEMNNPFSETASPEPTPVQESAVVQRLAAETATTMAAQTITAVQEPDPASLTLAPPKVTVQPARTSPNVTPTPTAVPTPVASQKESETAVVKKEMPAANTLPLAVPPIEPERPERKRIARQLKDISSWFDADKFVSELSKIINTTQTGDKFWSALALGNYVYVKPVGMYGLVVRHSKHNPEIVAAGASEQDRDDYLYTVVMELKKKKDLVAIEFLSGDRFGAVFIHNPGTDNTGTKQFLIPFRSDYFGEDIARAESKRNTLMKKTVALVPAFKGGN